MINYYTATMNLALVNQTQLLGKWVSGKQEIIIKSFECEELCSRGGEYKMLMVLYNQKP